MPNSDDQQGADRLERLYRASNDDPALAGPPRELDEQLRAAARTAIQQGSAARSQNTRGTAAVPRWGWATAATLLLATGLYIALPDTGQVPGPVSSQDTLQTVLQEALQEPLPEPLQPALEISRDIAADDLEAPAAPSLRAAGTAADSTADRPTLLRQANKAARTSRAAESLAPPNCKVYEHALITQICQLDNDPLSTPTRPGRCLPAQYSATRRTIGRAAAQHGVLLSVCERSQRSAELRCRASGSLVVCPRSSGWRRPNAERPIEPVVDTLGPIGPTDRLYVPGSACWIAGQGFGQLPRFAQHLVIRHTPGSKAQAHHLFTHQTSPQ